MCVNIYYFFFFLSSPLLWLPIFTSAPKKPKNLPNQFLLSRSATEGNSAAERSHADDRECYFHLIQLNKKEQKDNSSVNQVYS